MSFSSKYFGYLNRYMHNDRIICPEEKKGEWTLTFLETHVLEELNSGHAMTIVGWDDTIQIDMDGDGLSDSEGALKVANSWGSDWGNQGFFWIPYDSLKPQEDEGTQRVPAIMNYQIYFMMPKVSYTPLLLAEVTLETNSRRQLELEFGINTMNSDNAYEYQYACGNKIREGNITYTYKNTVPFCFKNYDRSLVNYDFYGNEFQKDKRIEASFVFDLTDLVIDFYKNSNSDAVTNGETRFYIRLEDNEKDGYSSVLKKIRIMDRATNSTRTWYENKMVDGTKEEILLDYPIIARIASPDKDFTLTFNYPIQEYTIAFLKVKKDGKIECQSKVSSIDDRKKIYIVPPSDGYQSGHPYSIDMSMIRSDGGNALNKENVFWFYVP